jgi:hypothetical protein
VARLAPDAVLPLPLAASRFVHVTRGEVEVTGADRLRAGDSALMSGMGGVEGTDMRSQRVGALGGAAEVLVWQLHVRR